MSYLIINSFDNIDIFKKSLIICDIDDTLIYFENIDRNWWDRQKIICNINCEKNEDVIKNIMDRWITQIKINNPLLTDKRGFEKMMNQIKQTDSKLIFITARPKKLRQLTINQLEMLDIDTNECPVYLVGDNPKGKYIKKNIELSGFKNVVFIDDFIKNIDNVIEVFGKKIKCFKFNR